MRRTAFSSVTTIVAVLAFVAAGPASGGSIVKTFPAGDWAIDIAYDQSADTIYASDYTGGTVNVIDARTRKITARIPAGPNPAVILADESTGDVYVNQGFRAEVDVIDPGTGSVVKRINTRTTSVTSLTTDPSRHEVYVSHNDGGAAEVIDDRTRTVVGTIPLGGAVGSISEVDPVRHKLFSVGYHETKVTDLATGTVVGTAPVGNDSQLITVDPVAGEVYTLDGNAGTVTAIDADTYTVSRTFAVPRYSTGLVAAPGTGHLYVTTSDHVLQTVDEQTGAVLASVTVARGAIEPARDPGRHLTYTANGKTISAARDTTGFAPTITAVDPGSGPSTGGTRVVVRGSGFAGATRVSIGGTAVAFTVSSDSSLQFTAPAHAAKRVQVIVVTPNGETQRSDSSAYVYRAP